MKMIDMDDKNLRINTTTNAASIIGMSITDIHTGFCVQGIGVSKHELKNRLKKDLSVMVFDHLNDVAKLMSNADIFKDNDKPSKN